MKIENGLSKVGAEAPDSSSSVEAQIRKLEDKKKKAMQKLQELSMAGDPASLEAMKAKQQEIQMLDMQIQQLRAQKNDPVAGQEAGKLDKLGKKDAESTAGVDEKDEKKDWRAVRKPDHNAQYFDEEF